MTKYITINKEEKKEKKTTVFEKILNADFTVKSTTDQPKDWNNVLHIGYDYAYGDVFKAWDKDELKFTIYFGKKGDEFE